LALIFAKLGIVDAKYRTSLALFNAFDLKPSRIATPGFSPFPQDMIKIQSAQPRPDVVPHPQQDFGFFPENEIRRNF
jgi:hypothetical protein